MLDVLQYPFMQRAIIAGVVLACLLAWLGVFVIMRKMSFFSDGIAHASLAGVAGGVIAGIHPLTTALVFSVVFALVIYFLEKRTPLSSDAIIGIGDDWDAWDDLALAADLSRLPKAKWSEMMKYHAEDFERAGLLTLSTDAQGVQHAFVKHTAMIQFMLCCFREVGQVFEDQRRRIAVLEGRG